jgi:hypothetical protein
VKPIKKPCFWGEFFEKIPKNKHVKVITQKKNCKQKKTLGEKLLNKKMHGPIIMIAN